MVRVGIFGAGGHAKVVWDILISAGHEVVGFAAEGAADGSLVGLPVRDRLDALPPCDAVVVAIGDNRGRRRVSERLRAEGHRFANAIHPRAVLSGRVSLGENVVIAPGAIVMVDAAIGDGAILNTGASVDHDGRIGAYAHLAPATCLAGAVTVGEGAFLGAGTIVVPRVSVGAWATCGAGAVVLGDVPAGQTHVGVPARLIRSGSGPVE